jgi:hypothetical protein
MMDQTMNPFNDKLKIALCQINASCVHDISEETLVGCIQAENPPLQWQPHVFSFLEELPVELIHDMVLSGIFTFQQLSNAIIRWECMDGPTTRWIKEMAALSMETAA